MSIASAHPVNEQRQAELSEAWGFAEQKGYETVRAFLHGAAAASRPGPSRPYEQVVAVFRSINFIGDALSMMPFMQVTADDRIIESGPLVELADNPCPGKAADDFWRESAGWLFLSRRLHWVSLEMSGTRPMSILPVPGELMRPVYAGGVTGSGGHLMGWLYRPAGCRWDQAIPLPPEQVYTIKVPKFDINNDVDGASTLDVIRSAASQVFKADEANERSLDHDVQPGGAFVTPPGTTLSEPQKKHFKSEVSGKNAGYANRNRFMLLEGGVDFKKFAATFSEMEFPTLQKMKFGDVAIGFGFDPAAIGLVEGGRYEFVRQAKASAWIDRILPIADWLAGHWMRAVQQPYAGTDRSVSMKHAIRDACPIASAAVRSCYGRRRAQHRIRAVGNGVKLAAFFDSSGIPAVREAMLSRAKEGAILIEKYKATPEQVIDLFDLGLPINDWQKIAWQTTSEMPLELAPPGDEDPAGPGDDPDPIEDEPDETSDKARSQIELREITAAQLDAIWTRWRGSWRSIEKAMKGGTQRHFLTTRGEVLANIERAADQFTPEADDTKTVEPYTLTWTEWDEHDVPSSHTHSFNLTSEQRDLVAELLFDLEKANGRLVAVAKPLLRSSYELGGGQAMREHADLVGQDEVDPFNLKAPKATAALRQGEIKVTGVNRTVRRRLARTIAEGLEGNEPISKITQRVRREFNFANRRATTIARTEIGRAVEEGRALGREQAGTPQKSWLWSRKETGRPWHMDTEQQTLAIPVDNGQDFTVAQTGNTCPHPRATSDPEDDINCGCTTISRFPGDSIKSVMGYYASRGFLDPAALKATRTQPAPEPETQP